MISIVNGKVFIDGKETINPELIGYAFLDLAEKGLTMFAKDEVLVFEKANVIIKTED